MEYTFWKENKIAQEYKLTESELLTKFLDWLKEKAKENGKKYIHFYGRYQLYLMFVGSKSGINSVNTPEETEIFINRNKIAIIDCIKNIK